MPESRDATSAVDQGGQAYVNIPEWVSAEMRAFLAQLQDPRTGPAFPEDWNNPAAWQPLREALESTAIAKYQPYIEQVQPSLAEVTLGGIGCVDIRPHGWQDDGKVLVFLHGGAHVFYRIRSMLGRGVAAATDFGLRVVMPDFIYSPEKKFLGVIDECVDAIMGIVEQGSELSDIAMFGDSSGGGLAASVALMMRDRGLGMPVALGMQSPQLDGDADGDTWVSLQNQETSYYLPLHRSALNAWANPDDQKNPYASPIYADFTNGFPPTFIQGGLKETLLSGMVRLYQKLEDAGIPNKLDLWEACPHNFPDRVPAAPESITARRRLANFLRHYLNLPAL